MNLLAGDMKLPARIQEAMQMQVEADRRKRATILESEGQHHLSHILGSLSLSALPQFTSLYKFETGCRVDSAVIVSQVVLGSNPADGISLRKFGNSVCQCLSEETLKAGSLFYLVSMPGEVKDPTQGVNV